MTRKAKRISSVMAIVAVLPIIAGCIVINGNFHALAGGEVYRSGQLNPTMLEWRVKQHTIRTVVSLRKPNPDEEWYQSEMALCKKLGVEHFDLSWSKNHLPKPASLAELIRIYDEGPKPMLVHCQGGTHRSGVASAVFVLLDGGTVEDAREQFGMFFNDAPIGRLIDLYEETGGPFRDWARDIYPGVYGRETGRSAEPAK